MKPYNMWSFIADFFCSIICFWNLLPKMTIAIMNLDAFFYEILKKTITPYTPPTAGGYLACYLLVAYKWSNYKKFCSLLVPYNLLSIDLWIQCLHYHIYITWYMHLDTIKQFCTLLGTIFEILSPFWLVFYVHVIANI